LFRNVVRREEVLRPWEEYYDAILDWVRTADEPYFLWVLLLDPHHPWLPPAEDRRWSSRWDVYRAFEQYWQMFNTSWEPDFSTRERQRLVDLYDDSIRYSDRFLARLQRDLRDDDPVFVVHADHGEEFGEHGRFGHQPHLYEGLTHVPLVLWNAGVEESVSRPVGLRSIAPTIAELADVPDPFVADSLLAERGRPWTVSKVFVDGSRRAAVRTRRGKYIEDAARQELYDLWTDPDERRNLTDDRPAVTDAFRDLLTRHVATEREKRTVREACDDLSKEPNL
jgi:arylsulfatase